MKLLYVVLILSPLLLAAQEIQIGFLFEFGNRQPFFTQLSGPVSISVNSQFDSYIADTGKNRIIKFDEKGEFVCQIGGFGWEHGQFQIPNSIFVYNSLDVFIADYENNRIERYDKDLNYISSYMNNQAWEMKWQFRFPKSVAASLHGDIFIIDGDNKRVLKFNPKFEPQLEFGNYDWGTGALSEPEDIFISRDDLVYVSDSQSGCIMVYDYFGNYLHSIGDNILKSPMGVFVYQNNLYVTDAKLNEFFIFSLDGNLIYRFGSTGDKIGAFHIPMDISVQKNRLYIVDSKNNRIQVFSITIQPE